MKAPELVFAYDYTSSIDIWAFGCTVRSRVPIFFRTFLERDILSFSPDIRALNGQVAILFSRLG